LRGANAFASMVTYPVGKNPESVALGDFNADGKTDLATANDGSDDVSVLLNGGGGAFLAAKSYPVGARPESVVAVDLNGDGKLDLATANGDDNTVSVLLNQLAAP